MALSVTYQHLPNRAHYEGSDQELVTVYFTFAGDASHLAAGDGLTVNDLGLATLNTVVFEDLLLSDTTWHTLKYDRDNAQVLTYLTDISGGSGDELTVVADGDLSDNTYYGYAVGVPFDVNA